MDIIYILYVFVALSVLLVIALILSLKANSKLRSSSLDDKLDLNNSMFTFKSAETESFVQTLTAYQKILSEMEQVTTNVSKLGHDINGALQVMMFTSNRIKKLNSNDDIDAHIVKLNEITKKIADLVSINKEKSKDIVTSVNKINLDEYLNKRIELFSDAYKSRGISYKLICEAKSADIQFKKNDEYILELILGELFRDYWLYTAPKLTLPICIRKSPKKTVIDMTFNLHASHDLFEQKYSAIGEKTEFTFVSIKLSKSKNQSFKISVIIPDL